MENQDNGIKRKDIIYIICSILAPVSGAATGLLCALLYTVTNLNDTRGVEPEAAQDYINWGWGAEFASENARAGLTETVMWLAILTAVLFAASMVILTVKTGKLNRFDDLWSELHLAAGGLSAIFACFLASPAIVVFKHSDWFRAFTPGVKDNYVYGIRNGAALALCGLGMAVLIEIAVLCWLSLVRKVKARELINKSLLGRLIRAAWRGLVQDLKKLKKGYRAIVVPGDADRGAAFKLIAGYILLEAALIILPLFAVLAFGGGAFIVLFASLVISSCIIIRKIGKLAEIRAGVIRVKSGDLSHRIEVAEDDNGPKTVLDKLASDINHISEATDAAVQSEIKNQRLKTDLISNVSHDLKTPLTSMISYLDILEKEGLDSPDAPAHLEVVREKTERLRELTEELFEAAKASSGNIPCEITDIDIAALIEQSLAELGDRLAAKDLIIRKNIKTEETVVKADGKLLYRVFENLLSNISKYALEGSRVYIDVTDDLSKAGRKLIEFKNISKDELNISSEELMERFTRGDQSRNTEGSGLGLAIAKDLTTLMGGVFDINIDGDMFKASVRI